VILESLITQFQQRFDYEKRAQVCLWFDEKREFIGLLPALREASGMGSGTEFGVSRSRAPGESTQHGNRLTGRTLWSHRADCGSMGRGRGRDWRFSAFVTEKTWEEWLEQDGARFGGAERLGHFERCWLGDRTPVAENGARFTFA